MSINLFDFKPAKKITSWDKSCSGLGMRLNCDGSKVYVVKYWLKGKQFLKTLCSTDLMTLEDARKLVIRIKTLARQGHDPIDLVLDCLGLFNDKAKMVSMAEFFSVYMERHAKVHKKSWKKDQQLFDLYIGPRFGARLISTISRLEINEMHAAIGKRSIYQANRVVELFQVMFKYAALWGFLSETHPNQARGVRLFRERSRDRFVAPQEMSRLIEAILNHPQKVIRTAILVDLHLGLRTSELVSLRWDYIDLDQKLLRLPDTKNGKPHVLPITQDVEDLLTQLPRYKDNPFVFQANARNKYAHISRIDSDFRQIVRKAGFHDLRPHDLRRTVGSWINNSGASLHMIGRVLNQTTTQVTAVYARHGMDPVRDVLTNHSQQLNAILSEVQQ